GYSLEPARPAFEAAGRRFHCRRAPPTRGDGLHGYGDCRRMIRETIRHAPRASAMHRPPHCPRTAPTYRLQTVSKTGAHLRVLARISEEVERGLNLPIRGAKRRIGVHRRLVTHVQRFRVRFPCATANFLISLVLMSLPRASPNCLQKQWLRKARSE